MFLLFADMRSPLPVARKFSRKAGLIDTGKCACFGSIRKSDVVDSMGVAVISNRTRCRLEIAVRETDRLEFVRKIRKIGVGDCGEYVSEVWARTGDVPGMGRPAAGSSRPRRMCV